MKAAASLLVTVGVIATVTFVTLHLFGVPLAPLFQDNRPPVAICLRGTMRYYRQAHASLVRNVIDANPQYRFDVFIQSSKWIDGNSKQGAPRILDRREVLSLYKPVGYVFEDPTKYDNKDCPGCATGPRNHVQLRRIGECYGLVEKEELKTRISYRWVLSMRSDLFFNKPLPLQRLPACTHCILGHFEWGCKRGGDVLSTMPYPDRLKGKDVCQNDVEFPAIAEAQVKARMITTPHQHIRNNFDWMYLSDSRGGRTMKSMADSGEVYGEKGVSAESYTVTYIAGAHLNISVCQLVLALTLWHESTPKD